jgi:hypothetical protein
MGREKATGFPAISDTAWDFRQRSTVFAEIPPFFIPTVFTRFSHSIEKKGRQA